MDAPKISVPEAQRAGVWANYAVVSHSPHEFTLDFVRVEPQLEAGGPSGLVVSRVSLSPLMVTQLIDALQENWQKYAERALPREAHE